MTLSRPATALLALSCLLAAAARSSAEPPPELRRLRVLLVVDGSDILLRDGVAASAAMLRARLEGGIPKDRVTFERLDGNGVTRQAVLDRVRTIKASPDEAVAVFYFGHGEWDVDADRHSLVVGAKQERLLRDELVAALHATPAALKVLLTDCCSTAVKHKPPPRQFEMRDLPVELKLDPVFGCLFFQHRGLVDITAADKGTYAFYDVTGGVFSLALDRLWSKKWRELDADGDGFVSWKELFPQLRKETNDVFAAKRKEWGDGELRGQTEQFACPFALPDPGGARGPEAFAVARLGVVLRPTPLGLEIDAVEAGAAARAGLTTGQVIVRADGQRVRTREEMTALIDKAAGRVRLELAPLPIRREVRLERDGDGYKLGARVRLGPDGEGAAVQALAPGGPGARLGVEVGDVIVGVNGELVRSLEEYAKLLDASPEGSARLEIVDVRNKAVVPREVTLAPKK